jgi:dipeptidase E
MKRNLLLISNSTNAGEKYLDWCKEMIADFCNRQNVKDVLFVPFAGVSFSYDQYEAKVAAVFSTLGLKIRSIHHETDMLEAVKNASCVAVGGGNTFHLVYQLQKHGLMDAIAKRAFEGMPYMGWSAGANVAGMSLKTTNDMPIIEPESFNCMSLVPFQINPHYTDFFDPKHGGETRDDRINEFIAIEPQTYVVGIREATALSLENGKLKLIGRSNKMKLFKANQNILEFGLNDDINFLMK